MTEAWPEAEILRGLELCLLEPDVRGSARELSALLHEAFIEVGSDGGVYTKAEVIEALQREADAPAVERAVSELQVHRLGPDLALVTYRVVRRHAAGGGKRITLRSSIWQRVSGQWRMRFHQGTLSK